MNVPGLQSNILSASKNKAQALGVLARPITADGLPVTFTITIDSGDRHLGP